MACLSLQHNELDHSVSIPVELLICNACPCCQFALHDSRLLGICSYVKELIPPSDVPLNQLSVKEDNRHISFSGCINDSRGVCSVHKVYADYIHTVLDHLSDLGILGLLALRCVVDYNLHILVLKALKLLQELPHKCVVHVIG